MKLSNIFLRFFQSRHISVGYYSPKMNLVPSDNDMLIDINTFVFLDMETTGLPFQEHNKTKMTELTMVAVEANHIRLGVFPRVQNKLSLCFNPRKMVSIDAEKLTGLSNDILERQKNFTSETVGLINNFLSHLQSPLCMVAHNGNNFDYPILRAEINKSGGTLSDIFCIDSLLAFQNLHFEQRNPSVCDTVDSISELPTQYKSEYIEELNHGSASQAQMNNENTPKKQIIGYNHIIPIKKMKQSTVVRRVNVDVSFKLGDIYHRFTKKCIPSDCHRAETDVLMLITCAASVGDKFVDWAIRHAKNFHDIPPMTPGKKIGT